MKNYRIKITELNNGIFLFMPQYKSYKNSKGLYIIASICFFITITIWILWILKCEFKNFVPYRWENLSSIPFGEKEVANHLIDMHQSKKNREKEQSEIEYRKAKGNEVKKNSYLKY